MTCMTLFQSLLEKKLLLYETYRYHETIFSLKLAKHSAKRNFKTYGMYFLLTFNHKLHHPRSQVFGVLRVSKALAQSMPTTIWLVAGSKQIWNMVDRYACILEIQFKSRRERWPMPLHTYEIYPKQWNKSQSRSFHIPRWFVHRFTLQFHN